MSNGSGVALRMLALHGVDGVDVVPSQLVWFVVAGSDEVLSCVRLDGYMR